MQDFTISSNYSFSPNYTPIELSKLSNEEHQQISLKIFTYGMTGSVNLPYKNYRNRICRGCQENNMYRNFELDTYSITSLQKELKKGLDNYININPYCKHPDSNSNDHITHIAELYIDLDVAHLTMGQLSRNESVIKLKEVLTHCFETGELPLPTMLIKTGRGYALHYKYKEYIEIENTSFLYWHNLLYLAILQRVEEILKVPELETIELEIDYRVRDRNRIARIAGTLNRLGNCYSRLESLGPFYSLSELQEAFALTDDEVLSYEAPGKVKAKQQKKTCKTKRESASQEILSYRPEDEIPPITTYPIKKTMEFNVKCLNKLYEELPWLEGIHRERFIFIYYNCAKILYGAKAAYEKVIELNENMFEPLSMLEVQYAVYHTDTHIEESKWHSDGYYLFSPRGIIEYMELTDATAEVCGFFDVQKKKQKYMEHNNLSAERDKIIAKLFIKDKLSLKKIEKVLPEEYKCSIGTIRNTLKRLNINKSHKGCEEYLEQLNFDSCRRYQRKASTSDTEEIIGAKDSSNKIDENSCQTFMETILNTDFKNVSKEEEKLDTERKVVTFDNFVTQEAKELYELHLQNKTENDEAVRANALTAIRRGENILLLGSGGTGKTHLMLEAFTEEELEETWFIAANGKASTHLPNGRTIHNAFQMPIGIQLPLMHNNYPISLHKIKRIIIDEIGQVRSDIFQHMMEVLHYISCQYHREVQIILLGDFGQICPVVTKEEVLDLYRYYKGKYAFHSFEWNRLGLKKFILQHSKRHIEKDFAEQLEALRFGCLDALHYFNNVLDKTASKTAITICPTNRLVTRYNQQNIKQFTNRKTYKGIVDGSINYAQLETKYKDLELAVDMRIMAVKNTKEFKNGMLGTITKINEKSIWVKFDELEAPIKVTPYTFHQEHGSFTQYPITYGYAITADKSQGMTLDEVNIIPGYFAIGQVYTALSRCRSMKGIHLLGTFKDKELLVDVEALRYCI